MLSKKLRSLFKVAGAVLFLISSHLLYAQCPSSIPNLSSYQPGAGLVVIDNPCLPKTITLLNMMAGTNSFKYYFNYTGGSLSDYFSSSSNTHTYNTPGEYTVILYSEKGGYPLLYCTKIAVADTLPPVASLLTCSNKDVKINFEADQPVDYEKYLIEWGDGDIDEIFAGYKTATHTYSNTAISYQIKAKGLNPSTGCHGGTATLNYTPTTTPATTPSLISVEEINKLQTTLTLKNPAKMPLKLLVKTNNGAFESLGILSNKELDQLQVSTDTLNSVCYKLEAVDNCLSDYKTSVVCSAPISVQGSANGNTINISTAPQSNEIRITQAQIRKDGKIWKEVQVDNLGPNHTLVDTDLSCGHSHCYQLVLTYENSLFTGLNRCTATHPEMCGLNVPLYIPTAFSPNDDAINDLFEIKGTLTTSFEITIFDKWGSVVFHSNDQFVSWDGTYKQKAMPTATYTYLIRLQDRQGNQTRKTGSVTLIR